MEPPQAVLGWGDRVSWFVWDSPGDTRRPTVPADHTRSTLKASPFGSGFLGSPYAHGCSREQLWDTLQCDVKGALGSPVFRPLSLIPKSKKTYKQNTTSKSICERQEP